MTDWFLALSINKQHTKLESCFQFQLSYRTSINARFSFETVLILSHRQTVLFYFTYLLVFSTLYTFVYIHTSHPF